MSNQAIPWWEAGLKGPMAPAIGDLIRIIIDCEEPSQGPQEEVWKILEISYTGDVVTIESTKHKGRVKCILQGQHIDTTQKPMQLVWLTQRINSVFRDYNWIVL